MFNSVRLPFAITLLAAVALTPLQNLWLQRLDGPHTIPPGDAVLALQQRMAVKKRLATEVIAGRLTLFQAAAHFRRVNRMDPPDRLIAYQGDSPEEGLCQEVIRWVTGVQRMQDPDHATDCCNRLEEELRCHKEQHGMVLLPAEEDLEDDYSQLPPPPPARRGGHDH